MNNNRVSHAQALIVGNVLYFAVAALATVYVVSESWHYGFWMGAFPLPLTLFALALIGATILGTVCLTRGVVRWLSLFAFAQLLAFAAAHGAVLSHQDSIDKMLVIMFGMIAAEAAMLIAAAHKGTIQVPTFNHKLSAGSASAIRRIALVAPLPIMALAGLQVYAQEMPCGSPLLKQATTLYLANERILFGYKRVDALCHRFVKMHLSHDDLANAELYAKYAVLNAEHPPLLRLDPLDIERRHLERHFELGQIYFIEGKTSEASKQLALYSSGCQPGADQ